MATKSEGAREYALMPLGAAIIDGRREAAAFAPEDDFLDLPTRRYMIVREIDECVARLAPGWFEDEGREDELGGKRFKRFVEMSDAERDKIFIWLDAPDSADADVDFFATILVDDKGADVDYDALAFEIIKAFDAREEN